jgi:AcrR family transcriptional regulator
VTAKASAPQRRPYSLGRRSEQSERRRKKILAAARAQLESAGFPSVTLDGLARESGVTRQTVHNLFGTKTGVLEALFDQLAVAGGLERMREVMQQADANVLLSAFVKVFIDFWSKDRLFIRRIHGIAAIDPEFEAAIAARNQRRLMAATRIVDRLGKWQDPIEAKNKAAILWALTSFEFFDSLAEGSRSIQQAANLLLILVKKEFSS